MRKTSTMIEIFRSLRKKADLRFEGFEITPCLSVGEPQPWVEHYRFMNGIFIFYYNVKTGTFAEIAELRGVI